MEPVVGGHCELRVFGGLEELLSSRRLGTGLGPCWAASPRDKMVASSPASKEMCLKGDTGDLGCTGG